MIEENIDREPDFINEEGVKWWINKRLTEYAEEKGLNYTCYIIEFKNGYRERAVVNNDTNKLIYSSPSLEAVGVYIDLAKFANS